MKVVLRDMGTSAVMISDIGLVKRLLVLKHVGNMPLYLALSGNEVARLKINERELSQSARVANSLQTISFQNLSGEFAPFPVRVQVPHDMISQGFSTRIATRYPHSNIAK